MPKNIAMACPFSNKACVECAIYRGRHFYLCFAKAYSESGRNMTHHSRTELLKAHGNEGETSKKPTAIATKLTVISNVEDLIEAEEFSRF